MFGWFKKKEHVAKDTSQQLAGIATASFQEDIGLIWLVLTHQLSHYDNAFPSDDFSVGYVAGVVRAVLIFYSVADDDPRAKRIFTGVFCRLYGPDKGLETMRGIARRGEATKGGFSTGVSEMVEFLKAKVNGETIELSGLRDNLRRQLFP